MLESFYNYIVDELLIPFFEQNEIEPGSRFYVIIENKNHRNGLLNAMHSSSYSKDITISNIFDGRVYNVAEESYPTFCIAPQHSQHSLIVGNSESATEDYLTTLRNAVSSPTSNYKDYGVLYILSSNRLESLTTASIDLQNHGMPLNTNYIRDNIKNKIDNCLMNANEKLYLKNSLERITQRIGDGGYTLFDFKDILGVLKNGSLKNKFSTLGYFEDDDIYDMFFTPSDKDLQNRIENNALLYNQVSDIILQSDGDERKAKLSKYLDDRLVDELSKVTNIENIDYSVITRSIDRKNAAATLTFEDVKLTEDNQDIQLLKRTKGNTKKKSTTYIIICDSTENTTTKIRLSFNSDIKGVSSEGQPNGRFLYIDVSDTVKIFTVGKDDNVHKFFIKRISARCGTFDSIHQYYSINKKGAIIIDVPEDIITLCIGCGQNPIQPNFGQISWEDDYLLSIPMDSADDSDKINISILFRGKSVEFVFVLSSNRVQPKSPMSIFEQIWLKRVTFHDAVSNSFGKAFIKICTDEDEYSVHDDFRKYLRLEKQMIEEHNYAMTWRDSLNEYQGMFIDITDNIRNALNRIFDYFQRENTVPSLCYIDEELEQLYHDYLMEVVIQTINAIPENRAMTKYELGLTHLGVIEGPERIMFSPFHPILVAYMLEFKKKFDSEDYQSNTLRLITPYYLIPYLYYNDHSKRPYSDKETEDIKTWLFYEDVSSNQQIRTYNITTSVVHEKINDFIGYFNYLFLDKNCPIIISTIGIQDDSNVIKGILEFIKEQYLTGVVQCIEIHEYVDNLLDETFFERLNRLNSDDLIVKELEQIKEVIDSKDYTAHEIIRQLFSRVSFYKHEINEQSPGIGYCHLAFYQMDTGTEFITPPSNDMRVELSLGGLISIPSTQNKDQEYTIGFGSKGLKYDGIIYPVVSAFNTLYANARNGGRNQFQKNISVSKRFTYQAKILLQSIYEKANWVTFLHPEVDINFFYKQNLYIVHYTDQYTINAKYDSITVTKHISQYENMMSLEYERYTSGDINVTEFKKTMTNYFNSLNGSWLLGVIGKNEFQIREKLSIVAASIIMRYFLSRCNNVIWLPISLDEILRVSGSIGMTQSGLFTAKQLGVTGSLSDDLLMMGLYITEERKPLLLIYPVEVKMAKSSAHTSHGEIQVVRTYKVLKEHLLGKSNFTKDIYKTFFASQYLANADKLYANDLLSKEDYDLISDYRFNLLNVEFEITDDVFDPSIGHAALVYFYSSVQHSLQTKLIDDVPVCHINLTQSACFQSVANPGHEFVQFLKEGEVYVSDSEYDLLEQEEEEEQEGYDEIGFFRNVADEIKPYKYSEPQSEIILNDEPESLNMEPHEDIETIVTQTPPTNHAIKLLIGSSVATGRDIIFEPNNTRMVTHPNMGIIGTMGTGKTQFARSILAQLSKEGNNNVGGHPVGILIFDYKGDYRDEEFLNACNGGKTYKYNLPFNPLKLIITNDIEGMNLPAITANRISDSFGKAYGLGVKQQNSIKQLILDTYEEFGITRDPETWGKIPPTMDDVVSKFFEEYDVNDSVYALFSTLRDYTIFTKDNSKCVSLFEWLDSVRVIDLTLYPDDTKKLIVSLILDLFYAEMQQIGSSKQEDGYRELRAMIMVDEAHQFLRKDFTALRKIISEGRQFGVGMILSTQNISDFKTSKEDYSQFVLSWVIHHVNSISKSEISSIFGASDQNGEKYMDFINRAKLFESVCKIGSRVEGIRDLPFFELIQQDERFIPEV
jgi:DNA phosphorothioation-dependent restriction protein DptH